MDLYLFHLINQFALKWVWLDVFGRFGAQYLGYILIIFLFFFLIFNFKKYRKTVVQTITAVVLARLIFVEIIRWLLPRPRPFLSLADVNLLIKHSASSAFPSGHAAFFFALSAVVYLYNKKIGIWFLAGAFLISLARVFVGVHWPSDVLVGGLVGIFSAWLVFRGLRD
jgi:undecaprenyl-diphosphatase